MRIDALSFKNDNKDTIIIVVDTYDKTDKTTFRIADIKVKFYRKHDFVYIINKITDDYIYRSLKYEDRDKFKLNEYLKYCTEEQLKQALMIAWEFVKPDLDNIVVF